MFDFDKYQSICANLLELMKKGRGGIYIGNYNILGTTIFGQQMVIDSRHSPSLKTLYVPPAAEIAVVALMLHVIKRGMICIDVGAGCGFHSLASAAISGPSGKVYSFEPLPECFTLLQENLEMNNIETTTCINSPVSDSIKIISLKYFGENFQFFFLDQSAQKEKIIEQESLTLDQYFADKETSIDFVKINVEKNLPAVINGMSDIILFNPSIKILCRFNKEKIIGGGYDPEKFLDEIALKKLATITIPSLDIIEKKDLLNYTTPKNILLSRLS